MKKRLLALGLAVMLTATGFAGCASSNDDGGNVDDLPKIIVGATPAPHAEILEVAKLILAEQGYDLVIREFTDYVQPNLALESGDLDANYFQHKPYMDEFNEANGASLLSAGFIHYEPLGLFPGKISSIDELEEGAVIAVPNDTSNEARALLLLEAQGLIKLKEGTGFAATLLDITENPKKLKITELEAAQIPRSLQDVDMAVINGNYAIEAGLNAVTDSLAKEEKDSDSATRYANIIAIKAGNEEDEKIMILMNALQSEEVRQFIEEEYEGAVVPMF